MDLTPVRIRGKRYTPILQNSRSKLIRKRFASTTSTTTTQPHASPFKKSRPEASQSQPPQTPELSHLERLPTELLEQIFWHCPNINLPAASLTLGQKLSSQSLKLQFFRLACEKRSAFAKMAQAYGARTVPEVQNALLRLSWVTYPLIRHVIDESPVPAFYPALVPILHLEMPVYIPPKLLHGPWTDEKLAFLEYMVRSGGTIDRINSVDGEIAEAGFWDALRARNVSALQLLSGQYMFMKRNGIHGHLAKLNFSSDWGVLPCTRHLRTAVLEEGCDRDVVGYLLDADPSEIDRHDPAVWEWLHDRKAEGDERGNWLEERLR
ncbi:MAG: hypothetical protein Q9163_002045 [Psora crenata]